MHPNLDYNIIRKRTPGLFDTDNDLHENTYNGNDKLKSKGNVLIIWYTIIKSKKHTGTNMKVYSI